MGNSLTLKQAKAPPKKVLVLGLDAAGKSTVRYRC